MVKKQIVQLEENKKQAYLLVIGIPAHHWAVLI